MMKVVNNIESIAEMRHLFMDQDLEKRDSLTFIWDNQIEELLKNPIICMIVDELWDSEYNVEGFIWNASTAHQMLFNYDHCKYDYEYTNRFYKSFNLKKIQPHCFVFEVWKNSGRSRYYIDTVVIVIFGAVLHYMIQTILEITYECEGRQTTFDNLDCTLATAAADCATTKAELRDEIYGDYAQQIWDYNLALAGISFMYMLFSIQIVINAIYSTVNNTVMRMKSFGYMIDGILFICFLTFVFITYAYNRDGTYSYQRNENNRDTPSIEIFYDNYRDNGRREDILLITIGILFWVKVFHSFRLIPFIGPLQAILKVMLAPIMSYLLFFATEILIFAAIAHLLFQELTQYKFYYDSVMTLFPAAIGSFDFSDIDESNIGSEGGKTFLAIFLLVNNLIVIANFIALLVVIYRSQEKYSTIFFSYTTLSLRPVSFANEKNSCLISAPVPLNGLHFLHMPVLMSLDDENAILMNTIILHIIYVPIVVIQVILFVIWCLVLSPVAYVKIFMHKMTISFTYSRIYRDERNNKFLYGMAWILMGPFLLLANIVRDTVMFVLHLYRKDFDTNYHDVKQEHYISNDILEQVANVLKNYISNGNRIVEVTTAVIDIRARIKVDEANFVKIFGQPPPGSNPDQYSGKKYDKIIQAFNIVKNMIVNNSSKVDNFDELIRELVDDPSIVQVKQTAIDIIDCHAILAFISNVLTVRVLKKVMIAEETDLFSKPLEKRKALLKELEVLYGTYKLEDGMISDLAVKQLELYMSRSIAYCNTRRIYQSLGFSPKNEKFLTKKIRKDQEEASIKESDLQSLGIRNFGSKQ